MRLDKLTERLDLTGELKYPDREITAVCFDSRKEIPAGCIFICIRGAVSDGHDFAAEAVRRGAAAIVADHRIDIGDGAELIVYPSTRRALSVLSAAWFGYPAEKLKTIGVTGTKGKSTTTYMIRNILEHAGHKVGVIGTIGIAIGDKVTPANNTTPDSYTIQESFDEMLKAGCDTAVMEVSSQGLKQARVYGIYFDYALFTNLEPDHIGTNEHASFEEYMQCKAMLFKQCGTAIVNGDDGHAPDMLNDVRCNVEAFGTNPGSDAMQTIRSRFGKVEYTEARDISLINDNGCCSIGYELVGRNSGHIVLSIPGRFNVSNSLAAAAVCSHFTDNFADLAEALLTTHVKGRLEPLDISDRFSIMIDYAHNAMALESLLQTLREYSPKRLVCLFGCGGNRSKERRFEMGEVSSKMADLSIITSDNPRFEKPLDIIEDILTGVRKADGKYIVIPDRREAIRYAIEHAEDGDVIVLAGKGQEDYQEIEGVKYHMDEREIVYSIAESLGMKH